MKEYQNQTFQTNFGLIDRLLKFFCCALEKHVAPLFTSMHEKLCQADYFGFTVLGLGILRPNFQTHTFTQRACCRLRCLVVCLHAHDLSLKIWQIDEEQLGGHSRPYSKALVALCTRHDSGVLRRYWVQASEGDQARIITCFPQSVHFMIRLRGQPFESRREGKEWNLDYISLNLAVWLVFWLPVSGYCFDDPKHRRPEPGSLHDVYEPSSMTFVEAISFVSARCAVMILEETVA